MDRLGQVDRMQSSSWRTRAGVARVVGVACLIALVGWSLAGRASRSADVSAAGGTVASNAAPAVGTSATTRPTPSWLRQEGFLATADHFVAFIQWTADHGYLSGTAQTVGWVGSPPDAATASDTVDVIGTSDGDRTTLTFGGQTDVIGPLGTGGFTVAYPRPSGSVITLRFRPALSTEFEHAVTALASEVDRADRVQASAQAHSRARDAVDTDVSNLEVTLDDMPTALHAVEVDVSALAPAIASESSAQATADSDERAVTSAGAGAIARCGLADPVVGDAVAVVAQARVVRRLAAAVESDLSILRADIADLATESAQRLTDEKATPGYRPATRATPTRVAGAAGGANERIVQALAVVNGDIDQANAAVQSAVSDTTTAEHAGACPGVVPAGPSVAHIT